MKHQLSLIERGLSHSLTNSEPSQLSNSPYNCRIFL